MDKLFSRIRLISDFNVNNLAGYLRNELPGLTIEAAPYGQVLPELLTTPSGRLHGNSDCALVWTQPESVISGFQGVVQFREVSPNSILQEVNQFADAILTFAQRVKLVCVPTWLSPIGHRGLGMLDIKHPHGISRLLMEMNLHLAHRLEEAPNIFVLDAQKWVNGAGRTAFSPKLWYMAKIPFNNEMLKEAAADITACIEGVAGKTRKLLVLDLDETLWGGVVGDAGWQNLRIGGHDYIGEAYSDFQRTLKALSSRGILLGIVSKNTESVALEAIRNHPDMILRLENFAGWKINWNDKAENVAELVRELNLGLQSVVFIDDNPAERARVREALPEVLVPDWPKDPLLYTSTLHSLRCFDAPVISLEDVTRNSMYASERQRTALKEQVADVNEWLATLEITVTAEALGPANLQRATQLLNKTNQMNLSTRRLSEGELDAWLREHPHRQCWTFRVGDRFGDAGLTGIASLEVEDDTAVIVDFLLSCRVMGRRVEEAILHVVTRYALAAGAATIKAEYQATPKNQPCLEFWKKSGWNQVGDTFLWNKTTPYPAPHCVRINCPELAHA